MKVVSIKISMYLLKHYLFRILKNAVIEVSTIREFRVP